jgi:hypothetical protein
MSAAEALPNTNTQTAPQGEQFDAGVSLAALHVACARMEEGSQTPYDLFLWKYAGCPRTENGELPPLVRTDRSGRERQYNNPNHRMVGFDPAGHLVAVRYADDYDPHAPLRPDALAVVSVDVRPHTLRSKVFSEWEIRKVSGTSLALGIEERLNSVSPGSRRSRRPLADALWGEYGTGPTWRLADLVLGQTVTESTWRANDAETVVVLQPFATLVAEVDWLTDLHHIPLDPARAVGRAAAQELLQMRAAA